jgi:hypothetical protein
VIFDYGGVLCYPPTREDVAEYARSSGLDHELFYKLYSQTREYYGRSADGYADHWKRLADAAGADIPEAAITQFIVKESGCGPDPMTRHLHWRVTCGRRDARSQSSPT